MESPLDHVPWPQRTVYTAARMLRGHRFGPIKDGWLLIYEHTERPPVEQLAGELCIVMTDDDRCLTRILRKGRLPGRWDLLTANNEQELDVALRWAAMVTMVLPYVPSEAEAQHWMAISATSSAAI